MAGLQVGYDTIRRQIGRFLGLKAPADWDDTQTQDVEDVIRRGLAMYYNPPATPMHPTGHTWSFLTPIMQVETVAGTRVYDLTDDFEQLTGNLTHVSGESTAYPHIVISSPQRLRELGQGYTGTGVPCECAIQAKASDGTEDQGWELVLHPTPNAAYLLEGQYVARQMMLDETRQYPLGGPNHSAGVLAACLSVAEQDIDGGRGEMYAAFVEKLIADINVDLRRGPRFIGRNTDPSTQQTGSPSISAARRVFGSPTFKIYGSDWQG
jgi:hypothetical protein